MQREELLRQYWSRFGTLDALVRVHTNGRIDGMLTKGSIIPP